MIGPTERSALLAWYDAHRRDLPWRADRDPYAVWVSEMMLHQTQIASMLPHYERWMAAFPTVDALAEADEQRALALWEGLGYYRRCRWLLEGARLIRDNGMPQTAEAWRALAGVGEYTAGAVASIAFNEPVPVVDGNVERVFARFSACAERGAVLRASAWEWARHALDRIRPGDWNQALMELGATVCTPSQPNCAECPLEAKCAARQSWRVREFPAPRNAPAVIALEHIVWVPFFDGKFGVRQIPAGEWWEGMWEFPRASCILGPSSCAGEGANDTPAEAPHPALPPIGDSGGRVPGRDANEGPSANDEGPRTKDEEILRAVVGEGWLESLGELRHTVTRHRILVYASLVRCTDATDALRWETPETLATLPMPAPQRKILGRALAVLGLRQC